MVERYRLSVEQQCEVIAKHRRCPALSVRKLACWAQEALNLPKAPAASTISRILNAAQQIEEKRDGSQVTRRRAALCPELESTLQRFVVTCEQGEVRLSRELLLQKARQILDSLPDAPDLTLSSGWLSRFQARHGIRFRHSYRPRNGTHSPSDGGDSRTNAGFAYGMETGVRDQGMPPHFPFPHSAMDCRLDGSGEASEHGRRSASARGWLSDRSIVRTVLITGAESRTGLAFVEHYMHEGWQVIATTPDASKAEKVTLRACNVELMKLSPWMLKHLDTADKDSIDAIADALEGVGIDLLINNAGIVENHFMNATTPEDCVRQFEVNALGPFLLTRALLRNLQLAVKTHGCAFVAQITSRMGSISENTTGGAYGFRASKSALHMFTKSLSVDLLPHKVGCLLLHPGFVDTAVANPGHATDPEESVCGMARLIASTKLGDPLQVLHFGKGDVIKW